MKFGVRKPIITESKADIQAFIDKFGQDTYDLFVKSKDRLKNNKLSTDIVWHTKNTSPEEMDNMLATLQQKMGNKDMSNVDFSKEQIPGKYKYHGRMGNYDVYEPLDYIASMALGVNTGWCTTGRFGHEGDPNFKPDESAARQHFNDYTGKGIRLIYLLDPKTHYGEYAIAIYPDKRLSIKKKFKDEHGTHILKSTNFELFNAQDDNTWDLSVLPKQVIEDVGLEMEVETVVDVDFGTAIEINPKDVSGVTLLSIEEANKFPTSIREYPFSWWLRLSQPERAYYLRTACVSKWGTISMVGGLVDIMVNVVRPALILNPHSSNLESLRNGDIIKVFDRHWYYQDNLALLMDEPLTTMPFNADKSKGNDYEKSDVKKWLDNWLAEQKAKYSKNESLLKEVAKKDPTSGVSPTQKYHNRLSKRTIRSIAKQLNDEQGIDCSFVVDAKSMTVHHIDDTKGEDGLKNNSFDNLWFICSDDSRDSEVIHKLLHYIERNDIEYDDLLNELNNIKIVKYDDASGKLIPKTLRDFKECCESFNKGLKEDMELNFDRALLDKWIDDLNAKGAEHHQTFSYTEGGKYIKVSYTYGGRYDTAVFAFVDADGNIYKPAGWKTPAKGVRARIDQNPPLDGKDLYSARYKSAVYGESVKEDEQRRRKKVYEGISDVDFEDIIAQFDSRGIDYSDAAYDTHIIWFKDDKEFEKAKTVLDRFRYKYVDGVNKRGTKYFELKEDWWDGGDSYFSHEQLMEFGSEFEEALQSRHGKMFEVGGVFFEPNNMLVVSITVNPYGDDFFVEKKIDMRRVKTTKDLNKYIPALLDDATKQIVDDQY